jgi:hypothetical protein
MYVCVCVYLCVYVSVCVCVCVYQGLLDTLLVGHINDDRDDTGVFQLQSLVIGRCVHMCVSFFVCACVCLFVCVCV